MTIRGSTSIKTPQRPTLAEAVCQGFQTLPEGWSVGSADTRPRLERACRLLYREYLERGYCAPSPWRLHYSPHMFGERSRTFVQTASGTVQGTLSIFPDDAQGLPLESLYRREIDDLRGRGLGLAEIGLLACRGGPGQAPDAGARLQSLFLLFKIAVSYGRSLGISHLLIAIHPRHRRLYESLGFLKMSKVRSYPAVRGHPALPMLQDLGKETEEADGAVRRFFLGNPVAPERFRRSLDGGDDPFAELFGDTFHAWRRRRRAPVERHAPAVALQPGTL